jgi:hypothetical protein
MAIIVTSTASALPSGAIATRRDDGNPPSFPPLCRRLRRSPPKSPPAATCDIHRISAPAARRDARVRVDDDDDDVDGVRADAQNDDDDDNDDDDVVQCGMRQCAPIDQLVDGVGEGGGGIEGGGAWGTTAPSEGRCHGRMSAVTSILPRREGDPIRRMKTTIIAGGDAARSAVAFRRDDVLWTMPPIIQPQTQQSNYGSGWRGRVKSQCL